MLTIKIKPSIILPFLFFFAAAISLELNQEAHDHAATLIKNSQRVEGVATRTDQQEGRFSNKITLEIESYFDGQKNNLLKKAYYLTVFSHYKNIRAGDRLKLENYTINNDQKKAVLETGLAWGHYFYKERLLGFVFASYPCKIQKCYFSEPSLYQQLIKKRERLFFGLEKKINRETFQLFSSIFFGRKLATNDTKNRETFAKWGLSHYLARSGLHIAIFTMMWFFLIFLLPISTTFRYLTLLTITLTYAAFSWGSISFFRALWLFIFFIIGRVFFKETSLPHLLSVVFLMITLTNPSQLFAVDFQLSFALTFALSCCAKIMSKNKS